MRNIVLIIIALIITCICSSFTFTGRFLGDYVYVSPYNKCALRKKMQFATNDRGDSTDTIFFNRVIFFDTTNIKIYDQGIFYGCHLKKDSVYTITLEPVPPSKIFNLRHSGFNVDYYISNCYFPDMASNRFVEREFNISGLNYMWNIFVDRNDSLYQIKEITPTCDCQMNLQN